MSLPKIEIYSDGACIGNPGPGGWAYILRHPDTGQEKEDSGGEEKTTNNRMELTAVIRALQAIKRSSEIHLCSDSQYVLKGITEWMPNWKKRGWKTAGKKPVMNVELWQQLDELLKVHDVKVEWVRGHTGHLENERCDELATREARMIVEGQQPY